MNRLQRCVALDPIFSMMQKALGPDELSYSDLMDQAGRARQPHQTFVQGESLVPT